MSPPLVVTIVHFGPQEPTHRLASLIVATVADAIVVVVANDGTQRPRALAPSVIWLTPPRNLGYFGALDYMLCQLRPDADAVAVLNNDVEPGEGTLERCLAEFSDPGVGVVAPVLRYSGGSIQSGPGRLTRFRRAPVARVEPDRDSQDCVWVTGALMLISTKMLKEVPLDATYFLGAEDTDLCLRAQHAGWRVRCVSEPWATHEESRVIGSMWYYYSTRNRVWFVRANFGRLAAAMSWFHSMVLLPRIVAADVLKRRGMQRTIMTLRGLKHGLEAKPALGSSPDPREPRSHRPKATRHGP